MQHVVFCFCDNLINVWDYFVGAAAWQHNGFLTLDSFWLTKSNSIYLYKMQIKISKEFEQISRLLWNLFSILCFVIFTIIAQGPESVRVRPGPGTYV